MNTPNVDWNKLNTEAAVDALMRTVAAEADEVQHQLNRYHECVQAGLLRRAELKYGLKVGCIVRSRSGQLYRVASIDPTGGKPWVCGNPQKKDGTWGIALYNLYSDWEVVDPQP